MKLPSKDVDALVAGMLPQLRLTCLQAFSEKVGGHTLINLYGRTLDDKGNRIEPGRQYETMIEKPVPIDHDKAMRALIKKAKTLPQMQDMLADYLLKNATEQVLHEAAKSLSNTKKNRNQ